MNSISELRNLGIQETIIQKIINHFNGQYLYIPKANKPDYTARNYQIYRDFDGKNIRAVCQKYDLCAKQIRKIISSERKKHQYHLFE